LKYLSRNSSIKVSIIENMTTLTKPRVVPVDDSSLVEKVRQGDENAFYDLYRRYARYVAGVAYRILSDDADLDDVVQETFISAAEKMHQLKQPEHVRLWLVAIALRHAKKRFRMRSRPGWRGLGPELEADKHADPAVRARLDEAREVLGQLPEKLTTPWILHRVEGMTIAEVAVACSVSAATVKRHVASAEAKIRRRIDVD